MPGKKKAADGEQPPRLKTVVERSAGGVVGREEDGQLQVVLIATENGARWGLPKGLVERGEDSLVTAAREVAEETGLHGRLLWQLSSIEYWYRRGTATRVHKFVDFYLFAYESGDVADHDWEVEVAAWFPVDEAIERTSYRTEKDVLRQARTVWAAAMDHKEGP